MEQATPKTCVQLAILRPCQELMKFAVTVCIDTFTVLVPLSGRLENDAQVTILRNHGHGDIMKGEVEIMRPTTHNQDSSLVRPNPKGEPPTGAPRPNGIERTLQIRRAVCQHYQVVSIQQQRDSG